MYQHYATSHFEFLGKDSIPVVAGFSMFLQTSKRSSLTASSSYWMLLRKKELHHIGLYRDYMPIGLLLGIKELHYIGVTWGLYSHSPH